VARVGRVRPVERRQQAARGIRSADRLDMGARGTGEQSRARLLRRVDQRSRERHRRHRGLRDRRLGQRLGAVDAQRVLRRGAERRHEQEALDPGALGGAQQPPGREAVELLETGGGLVAPGAGQVDDRAHAAQRVAERAGVGEVSERDLDAHPRGTEPAWIADEAADRLARRDARQQRRADLSRGACQQQHGPEPRMPGSLPAAPPT